MKTPLTLRLPYIAATAPFLFLWLLSHGHAEALWLLGPALLCIVQVFYPTRPIWIIVFGIYLVFAGSYGLLLIADIMILLGGNSAPSVLVDADDSFVFVVLELALVGLAAWLWLVRPKAVDHISVNPFSDPDQL